MPGGVRTSRRTSPSSLGRVQYSKVNWPVFATSGALIILTALWAGIWPDQAGAALSGMVGWVSTNLGWFYILVATVALAFVLIVALSRLGDTRLGPDNSRPQFSLYSWAAMLFAAGIGVDLLFFSVAEPVAQFYGPPEGDPKTVAAARQSIVLTLFHYGITGWAMYALMGMCFGYFAYRRGLPLSVRSALMPLIGRRVHGVAGHGADVAAVLGTVFGVATSLGIGVVQLNYGLTVLFGIPQNATVQLCLIGVAVAVATVSAISGVDKGIKRLSEMNVALALLLTVYVLVTGKTADILDGVVQNVGDYASSFLGLTLNTYAYSDASEWLGNWTLFFWAWWIAWAPFVGLFLARISKGRTLRQFVVGTLTLPFVFVLTWIGIFGNAAIHRLLDGDDAFGQLTLAYPERGFYALLQDYPGAGVVTVVVSLVGLLLYITSADSAALVTSNLSAKLSGPDHDGPRWSRVFWAMATGALTMAMLLVGGIPALLNATLVIGLPFALVMILAMVGLARSLGQERYLAAARQATLAAVDRSLSQRLSYAVTYPDEPTARRFIAEVALPALAEVAAMARDQGLEAIVDQDNCKLTIPLEGEDFIYRIEPVPRPMPSFAMRIAPDVDVYYRLEVCAGNGPIGRDVAGLTREQVCADVLALFSAHLDFLERSSKPGLGRRVGELKERLTSLARVLRNRSSVGS